MLAPSKPIQNSTPFTKLFNKPTTYKHLIVFGCLCYPHIPTPHKLALRSTPCVFLGYPSHHKGFRCFDLSSRKIIISQHFTFDETVFPFDKNKTPTPPSYHFLDHDPEPNIVARRFLTATPDSSPAATGHAAAPLPSSDANSNGLPTSESPDLSSTASPTAEQPPSDISSNVNTTPDHPSNLGSSHTQPEAPTHPMVTRGRASPTSPICGPTGRHRTRQWPSLSLLVARTMGSLARGRDISLHRISSHRPTRMLL